MHILIRSYNRFFKKEDILNSMIVDNIRLDKIDSFNLVNTLFRPSENEIADRKNCIDGICNNISIRRNDNGFEAEVDDLDMSFLDESVTESYININVNINIDIMIYDCYEKFEDSYNTNVSSDVDLESNQSYETAEDNLSWAA